MLSLDGCRVRQERFIEMLERNDLDGALVSDPRDIYYLTGVLLERFPALLYIETEGLSWLVAESAEGEALVDTRETYDGALMSTLNPDPMRLLAYEVARKAAGTQPVHRIGWQAESLPKLLADVVAAAAPPDEWVCIDDQLLELQRSKEPDEIDVMREAIDCSLAAYDADRAAIAPGINELAVLEAGHTAATLAGSEADLPVTGSFRPASSTSSMPGRPTVVIRPISAGPSP
jgi:Xaa-Pro aminopeptidase